METMENHGMDAEFNFESALEDYLSTDFGDLEEGTIVKGEIVRVDDDNVLVDVNFKSEGQIPTAEFRDAEGNLVVKVGDRVDVFVARKNEQEGTITLSFEKAKRMQLFDQLEDVQEKNGVNWMSCVCAIDRATLPPLANYWAPGVTVSGLHELVANALVMKGEQPRTMNLRQEDSNAPTPSRRKRPLKSSPLLPRRTIKPCIMPNTSSPAS